jgi:urease subunit alpha
MLHNTATPLVEVAPEPIPVRVDGREIALHRSTALPLTRLHHLG